MPSEVWGSLVTFATVLVTTWFGYLTAKTRQQEARVKDYHDLEEQNLLLTRYNFTLRKSLESNGVRAPLPPKGLRLPKKSEELEKGKTP